MQIHKYKYTNIRIQKYKYTNTNTQIQLLKYNIASSCRLIWHCLMFERILGNTSHYFAECWQCLNEYFPSYDELMKECVLLQGIWHLHRGCLSFHREAAFSNTPSHERGSDSRYLISLQHTKYLVEEGYFSRRRILFDVRHFTNVHIWAPQSAVMSNNIWIQLNVSSQPR